MKIYLPIWDEDIHTFENPFASTFIDEICKCHSDVVFHYGLHLLWEKECEKYDIIHFMWPQCFSNDMLSGKDFEGRLKFLKSKGVKIVSTCHNLHAHIEKNKYYSKCYDIVYSLSDVMVHLGNYSMDVLRQSLPNAKHVLIPHHIYDTIYASPKGKEESLKYLGLSDKYRYILCFGAFRNIEEKIFIRTIAQILKKDGVRVIAPSIIKFDASFKNNLLRWLKLRFEYLKYMSCGIITKGGFVSDEELPYYYGVSDISLIQRIKILNSGNLPLGFYMKNVVVGPNTGNVGLLLLETGNPVFNPSDMNSVLAAIKRGFELNDKGKGNDNHNYSMKYLRTSVIAEMYYKLYCSII